MKKKEETYLNHRKIKLKELHALMIERFRLNKNIRGLQRELNDWDKILLE